MRRSNMITAQLLPAGGENNSGGASNVHRLGTGRRRARPVLRRSLELAAVVLLLCEQGVIAGQDQPAKLNITSQEALEKFIAHQEASLTNQLQLAQRQAQ